MKKWIVRLGSLLVFNVVLLLVIGWLTPARVGWSALWAGIILTAATVVVKPAIGTLFRNLASRSASSRTKAGQKVVEYVSVYIVALIVWALTVWFSGVRSGDWLWGWVLPPLFLLIGWAIYDAVDDRVEARAGALYDKATGAVPSEADAASAAPAAPSAEEAAGRRELRDGLTDEQRKLLDEL